MTARYWHQEALTGLLEITASQRPDLLPVLVEILQNSVAWHPVAELAHRWGVKEETADREKAADALVRTLNIATAKLSRMERLRGRWRAIRPVEREQPQPWQGVTVTVPSVAAVVYLARARATRSSAAKSAKLERIIRNLEPVIPDERAGRLIEELMGDEDED